MAAKKKTKQQQQPKGKGKHMSTATATKIAKPSTPAERLAKARAVRLANIAERGERSQFERTRDALARAQKIIATHGNKIIGWSAKLSDANLRDAANMMGQTLSGIDGVVTALNALPADFEVPSLRGRPSPVPYAVGDVVVLREAARELYEEVMAGEKSPNLTIHKVLEEGKKLMVKTGKGMIIVLANREVTRG